MLIYICVVLIIILSYIPLSKTSRQKKLYCCIVCVALCLVAGLRDENLGLTDTAEVYKVYFYRILNNNYAYVLQQKDWGFQTLTYLFTRIFGDNFLLYVFIFTIPYIIAISFLIYKFSDNKPLSFIVFMCLHYFEISFTLMRQINGMALLCIALYFFINRKFIKYIIFVLIASLFHQICIVFLFVYIFRFIPFKKWMIVPILVLMIITLLLPDSIMQYAYDFIIGDERYSRYEEDGQEKNLVFFLINLVMWIFEFIYIMKTQKSHKNYTLFVCTSICLVISPLTVALGEMSRVAYLFGVAHIVLLPNSVAVFDNKSKVIINIIFAAVFLLYFFLFLGPQVNIIPYSFGF